MPNIRFLRPTYFIWLAPALAVFAFVHTAGLPHLVWSYDWYALGPNSDADFSQRHYTRCTYIGPYGGITVYPQDGSCGLIRFFPKAGERG